MLIVLPLYAVKVYAKTDYTDFFVYYRAATRARFGLWDNIYTLNDGASPFRYAPWILPFFRPFAALSLRQAQLLWYFCQFAFFATGFGFLYRSARLISSERAGIATCFAVLFVLRFCLDCFTIGQSSSLMFLGYCLGLYGYMRGAYFTSGAGVFLPTLFKISPGFSFLLYPFSKFEEWIRAWLGPIVGLFVLSLATYVMVGGRSNFVLLFSKWRAIVASDDQYYDASHYGSQALKSFLLRLSHAGWIPQDTAYLTWFALSAAGCAFILWVWGTRRARSAEGKGYLYALGIFPYLWFMPETFKYSLAMLAIPAVLLAAAARRTRLAWFALGIGVLTLSLAGKDLMPDALFFGLQRASMPLLASVFLGAATLQALYRETVSWRLVHPLLPRPWESLPVEAHHDGISVLIPLSEDIPSRTCLNVVTELEEVLKARFGSNWELIWIAPREMSRLGAKLEELTRRFQKSKLVYSEDAGRGSCLREGFLHSSGRWIYLYRIEQPVGVQFVDLAIDHLKNGDDLIRANRRDPDTRFLIPVKNLRVAYRRHRLGMAFNRLARWALPGLLSVDTHSGHLLLSRAAAAQVFALQTTGDFLFDLEICVIAKAHGFRETELPVNLYLFEEKSGERILAEIISVFTGLPRLRRRYRQGCYDPLRTTEAITADDWGLSPAVNQGILALARRGVIRRVSLMANTRFLAEGLQELKSIPGIQLGMHFTLTYGRALSKNYRPRSPRELFFASLNPFSDRAELRRQIQEELRAQLQVFSDHGVTILYFDGHHHIHLIPGLIESLAPILKEARIHTVRLPYDPALKFTTKFPLLVLSMLARTSVERNGFKSLRVFYPQREHFLDHGLMRARINRNPSAEVIVHPASHNDIDGLEFPDSYTEGRVDEFKALQMLGFVLQSQEIS